MTKEQRDEVAAACSAAFKAEHHVDRSPRDGGSWTCDECDGAAGQVSA